MGAVSGNSSSAVAASIAAAKAKIDADAQRKKSAAVSAAVTEQLNILNASLKQAQASLDFYNNQKKYFMLTSYCVYPRLFKNYSAVGGVSPNTEASSSPPGYAIEDNNRIWVVNGGGSVGIDPASNSFGYDYTFDGLTYFLTTTYADKSVYPKGFEGYLKTITYNGKTYYDLWIQTGANYQALINRITTATANVNSIKASIAKTKAGPQTTKPVVGPSSTTSTKVDTTTSTNTTTSVAIKTPTKDYAWNLPPHKWSLPVRAGDVNPDIISNPDKFSKIDGTRRGILFVSIPSYSQTTADGKAKSKPLQKYGFQFLWNPASITYNVGMNLDVTPTVTDHYLAVNTAYGANSQISVTITLDRTNDFACFRSRDLTSSSKYRDSYTYTPPEEPESFYRNAYRPNSSGDPIPFSKKFDDLLKYGTLADLDYLYKAINGDQVYNVLGTRKGGDIGFIMPTLMRFDLGDINVFCIVTNISVNHTYFTPDMTPLRTEVTLSLDIKANVALSTDPTAGNLGLVPSFNK